MDNRHPADELAEVRQKMRELKEREDELRNELLALPLVERIGVRYVALAVERASRNINIEKLKNELGNIDRFYKTTNFTMLKLEKLIEEGVTGRGSAEAKLTLVAVPGGRLGSLRS